MTGSDRSVEICLGPGGVGKTTMAAAAGIAAARSGRRVVVLTIDPARRLADTLGLDGEGVADRGEGRRGLGEGGGLDNEPKLVAGDWAGELWAAMLDPAETLAGLIRRHGGEEQAEQVLANPLFAPISGSLSGVNEYMAAERLHELHHDPRFDRVIIDTPPSRHAVDFLDSPGRLMNFIDNRFYKAVLAPKRGIARTLNVAAQHVVRLTARLVGAGLVDDVIKLFADLEGLDEGFRQRAVETAELLNSEACSYALVTTARRQPIREAGWIRDSIERRGKTIDTVIVNRVTPWGRDAESAKPAGGRKADRAALQQNLDQLRHLSRREDELVVETIVRPATLSSESREPDVVRVAERDTPIATIDDLIELAEAFRPLQPSTPTGRARPAGPDPISKSDP